MSTLFMRLGLGAGIAFPFYIVVRLIYSRQKKVKSGFWREILLCLFVLFMAGLILLVLWPGALVGQSANYLSYLTDRFSTGVNMNFTPFRTIRSFFADNTGTPFVINIVANVLMFSPLGLCLPLLWERFQKWWKMFCVGIAFSTGIETAQIFVGRSVDIDDIILNAAGVMLGYIIFILLKHWMPDMKDIVTKK